MGEILYRGKKKNWNELPKEEQQWIEGYYCKRKSGHYTDAGSEEEYKDCIVKEFSDKGINFADVDPETVCQYTGWTDDINEKKIFEGNIIKVDDWWTGFIYWNFNDTVFEVYPYDEFSNRSIWGYVERLGCVCNGNMVEVIGNIFDNTDLIPKDADLDLVKSRLRGSL